MTRGRWIALGVAVVFALFAWYLPHLNLENVVSRLPLGETDDDSRMAAAQGLLLGVAAAIAALVGYLALRAQSGATQRRALWFVIAALLLVGAVYLNQLRFDDLIGWLWGDENAEPADRTKSITMARWALVALAIGIVLVALRHLWVELGLLVLVVLVAVAAGASTEELLARVDRPEAKEAKPAFDRGFALPAEKIQRLPRGLARERCVTLVVVKEQPEEAEGDEDAEEDSPTTFQSESYEATLLTALEAGVPSSPVAIELAAGTAVDRFATDLVAATAIFLLSTDADQAENVTQPTC